MTYQMIAANPGTIARIVRVGKAEGSVGVDSYHAVVLWKADEWGDIEPVFVVDPEHEADCSSPLMTVSQMNREVADKTERFIFDSVRALPVSLDDKSQVDGQGAYFPDGYVNL